MTKQNVAWVVLVGLACSVACRTEREYHDATGGMDSGGEASGGVTSSGGTASGGSTSGGRVATGGAPSDGGSRATGGDTPGGDGGDAGSGGTIGNETGGSALGGNSKGGNATTGGKATGGNASGGASGTGGKSGGGSGGTGGNATGGNATGGTGGGNASGPVRVGFSVFHDSASGEDQASSHLSDATFAKPADLKAGDFMLVFFGADHSLQNLTGTQLAAKGWTLLDQHADVGVDGQATYLIYKFASASEPSSIVFAGINPLGSGNGVQGLLSVYRGVNATEPIQAYATVVDKVGSETQSPATVATPTITTTVPGCLALAGLSPDTQIDAPLVTVWPQGFTQNQVSVNNLPNPYPLGWANIYLAERPLPNAGVVPASAFSWVNTNDRVGYYGALTFVLALAP